MNENEHLTITIPALSADTYRALADAWAAGVGMFTTAVYPKAGGTEPSHYISSGAIDADIAALLNDPAKFVAKINERTGGNMTVEQAQNLRDGIDIAYLPESGRAEVETVEQTLTRLELQRQPAEIL